MRRLIVTAAVVALVAAAPRLLEAQHNEHTGRFEFTAVATSIGLPGNPVGQAPVDIVVSRWSTEMERRSLLMALTKDGQRGLLDKLQGMKPVGTIRVNNQGLAYDLRYSHEKPDPEGGRQIVLGTDRPISAWEALRQPRSIDYPFTVIQMHLDDNGEGQGTVVLAARVTASDDGRYITVENLAAGPIKLTNIKQE
ncbi:MAG TPA: hypothetical protein VG871_10845 [Vicinamibacterales bacterium]|nr:hypothetical protein [Vicinamibacterales bacterium]